MSKPAPELVRICVAEGASLAACHDLSLSTSYAASTAMNQRPLVPFPLSACVVRRVPSALLLSPRTFTTFGGGSPLCTCCASLFVGVWSARETKRKQPPSQLVR